MNLHASATPSSHEITRSANPLSLQVGTKPPTGLPYVDGILWGGNHWEVGANRIIDYSFLNRDSARLDDGAKIQAENPYNWRRFEKEAVERALNRFSQVANIKFEATTDDNPNATLKFYNVDSLDFPFDGLFGPPGESNQGFGYFNRDIPNWNQTEIAEGTYAFNLLLHEISHGLGLAHPHDNGGGSSLFPGVGLNEAFSSGTHQQNQGIFTIQSYISGKESDATQVEDDYGHTATPVAFDIAALQHLYGAAENNTGNTIYTLPEANRQGTFYASIWDTGGIDSIRVSNSERNASIDLRAAPLTGPNAGGYLSQLRTIKGGFIIANGVEIENAVGGDGNDRIQGNPLNNHLRGQSGDDLIWGDLGDDRLRGQTGEDQLFGGLGADTLRGGQGQDWLKGNDGDDLLIGGRDDDILIGDRGDDTLIGNVGADTFRLGAPKQGGVDILADFRIEDGDIIQITGQDFSSELNRGLLSDRYFVLGRQASDSYDRIIYHQGSGSLYFDEDGAGGDRQQLIAQLPSGLALSHRQFQVV